MSKKMCKLVKEDYLEDHFKEYSKLVRKSKFVCTKCGRASNDASLLCKSKKIKEKE